MITQIIDCFFCSFGLHKWVNTRTDGIFGIRCMYCGKSKPNDPLSRNAVVPNDRSV